MWDHATRLSVMWMSHVTCEWAMFHMNEWSHVWMGHVKSYTNESYACLLRTLGPTCTRVVSHFWMRHVTFRTHAYGTPHVWMRHATHRYTKCWHAHVVSHFYIRPRYTEVEVMSKMWNEKDTERQIHWHRHTHKRTDAQTQRRIYTDDIYGVATISRLLQIVGLFCRI